MIPYVGDTACFFDIEYVPDIEAGRRVYGEAVKDSSDAAVLKYMEMQSPGWDAEQNPTPILKNCFYKVIAISCVLRNGSVRLFTLPNHGEDISEAEILTRFLTMIGKKKPQLFSWAGLSFDLPVLRTRALMNSLSLPEFFSKPNKPWEGVDYHTKFSTADNVDLQEILMNSRRHSLHEMATALRIPGKVGVSGDQVGRMYLEGKLAEIIQYCETDAATTYLVGMRHLFAFGLVQEAAYIQEIARFRSYLESKTAANPQFTKFLAEWDRLEAI